MQLIQFPWSPFCLVQRRILEYGKLPHRIINVPPSDRSLIWRLTKHRYYQVPVLKHGHNVLFETDENSQVIAKYLDGTFHLGLFVPELEGLQSLVWRCVENEIEGLTFRLNDAHFREFVPRAEQLNYRRHKERKFGSHCLELWLEHHRELLSSLAQSLLPFEQMLSDRPFLLDHQPRFVDFDLWGMLANFHYSGHYRMPRSCRLLSAWYRRMTHITLDDLPREKLHPRHQRSSPRSRRDSQLRRQ